jgi:hypothetical protein
MSAGRSSAYRELREMRDAERDFRKPGGRGTQKVPRPPDLLDPATILSNSKDDLTKFIRLR